MSKQYAYVVGDVVMDVLRPVMGFDLAQCCPPDVLEACIPCGPKVQPGWVRDGNGFAPPALPEPPLEEARAVRLMEIDARIRELEAAAARPGIVVSDIISLAAVEARDYTDAERYTLDLEGAWLAEYRAEIEDLRVERAGLG